LPLVCAAVLGSWLLAPAFIPGRVPAPGAIASGLRGASAATARSAEGEGKEEEGGFLKFLKVEQDIELSPEEYKMALDQEIEAQRKRYYIGGEVKPNNLIVPWKPVDEKQLEADARRQLKKNGIVDPSGEPMRDTDEDSLIDIQIIGEQDVQIDWTAGVPGTKVGYIVERKRQQETNFQEIATYENMGTSFLLAQPYAGHEYSFTDEIVAPGPYTYRVLCRVRSGEISVVDQKDIVVPELSGVDSGAALIVFVVATVVVLVGAYFYDPVVS